MNLLTSRRFLPLFITQFFGAFNDNLFKNALVMLVTFKAAQYSGEQAQMIVILAGALFMLPYFLFSATAGELADKIPRDKVARMTKIWEMVVVVVGAIGFLGHYTIFLLLMLFALGAQSTFFGPVKYALLPQHLTDDELLTGNAYIEAGTFLAILTGTICGGVFIMQTHGEWLVIIVSIAVSLSGYLASRFIPYSPAPQPQLTISKNLAVATWRMVSNDRKNVRVFRCILAISWFWVLGATLLSQFPALVKNVIGADDAVVTLFLTLFSIGVGIGSYLSTILTRGIISSRFVPWAAFFMALFTLDSGMVIAELPARIGSELIPLGSYFSSFAHIRLTVGLLLMSVAAGVFIVPLYAIMQHDSAAETRARTIATNNILNALCMVMAAVITVILLKSGATIAHIFLLIGAGSLAVAFAVRRIA